ncbi:hypothetical protein K438DRAFT_1973660 [Mycena galopus ATCC 62051]|nr:hypothetical protein K438DRAFT_1973660 [Mycena galopus ATCC 62051]
MDGNNSLKRFWRRRREQFGMDGRAVPGESKERDDNCVVPGDYYLPHTEVDAWAKDEADELMRSFESSSEEDEGAGCSEGWQNMKEDVTARAWGMYDDTGIFPALCRHGFVLVVVDMVKSGELAKYGLSVINHLIRVLGEVGMGHDIGCKTAVMVKTHPRLSRLASDNKFRSLVGSFHGHGHNCLCQVSNLATYMQGMGLEDCVRADDCDLKHTDDCNAYQGLIIANKYRRALKIKLGLPALHAAMKSLGVTAHEEFAAWLGKEKEYLRTLTKEPIQETMEMEYYQKLLNYRDNEDRAGSLQKVSWMQSVPATGNAAYAEAAKQTHRVKMQRHHAEEVAQKSLTAVQDLEVRLGITTRWVPGSEEWEKAAKMVSSRCYQRALDQLQGLVVAQMFELTKIARLVTYMADEEEFLVYHEGCLRQEGEDALAHQMRIHRGWRSRFNAVHMQRLVRLSKEPGFTADIFSCGVSVSKERRVPAGADTSACDVPMPDVALPPPQQRGANADVKEDEDEDLEGVAEAFEAIVRIAHDVEATGA